MMRTTTPIPRFIVEDGMATAVILDIDLYEGLLNRHEAAEGITVSKEMREKSLEFQSLEFLLAEVNSGVRGSFRAARGTRSQAIAF